MILIQVSLTRYFILLQHHYLLLLTSSRSSGIVPAPLKTAKVVPIHKQGHKDELTNYRPISILPYFSKLLEKVMYSRLFDNAEKTKFIMPFQHGFLPGHSTVMSLLNLQNNILAAIDRNE